MTDIKTDVDWMKRKERGSLFLLRLLVWLSLFFGRNFARLLLYPISLYFMLVATQARQASRQYLQKVLGRPVRWRDIFSHFFCFATISLDRIYFLNGQVQLFSITLENEHLLRTAMQQHSGIFLFGAHMGSFEALRALGHQHTDYSLVQLMYQENAKKLGQVLAAINPELQQEIIPLGNLETMMRVHEALKQGAMIGILADRTLQQTNLKKQWFLGEEAAFSESAFRLAAILRKPVLLMLGLYLGGNQYRLVFEEIYDFSIVQEDQAQAITVARERYVDLLAKYCQEHPYNWFNFYNFWQTSCKE
ncbi:acyl-CoA synthetase [Nitrosomonas sp. JL21]|uniref:LpxL/LpxP family acyltransferase n=1 Tax=Nitrosomonas sp. JL21 TaxID=153949 RepID=UPI00137175B2|nr:acyl-CoA synthetase [Nitrosomonas sp. JL21]MBL8498123.1 acyl-CoA synthetase [Nitrosomonas sp.]